MNDNTSDNDRHPPSQGASGRSNPARGASDSGRDADAGRAAPDQGLGDPVTDDPTSEPREARGRQSSGRGSGSRPPGGSGFGGRGFGSQGSGVRWSRSWSSGGWGSGGGRSGGFRPGLPGMFIVFAVFAFLFGAFASCSPSGPGQVAGQIQALSADRTVSSLAGAQVILRGGQNTYTTVSTEVAEGAEGTDAYNYRFENVPPGRYTMAVTPPAGSNLQPEADITVEVESDETFPQSVMLLAEGIQKPRPLSPSELNPGEVGYINERGERVVYQQGSGFGLDDALLMYLLFRNPPAYGYGAPPIIYSPSRSTPGSGYRWDNPPSRTSTGSRVTTRPPSVPGQGSTRPSSGAATGAGPTYRSGDSGDDSPASSRPPASTGSNGTTTAPANRPSQGVTRPSSSSSTSSPSRSTAPSSSGSRSSSSSSGSRSSSGGRR